MSLTLPKLNRRRQELLTSHAIEVIDFLGAAGEIIVMVRRPKRAILKPTRSLVSKTAS